MAMPFPGMDPYLEHPVLWTGVHTRMIVYMADQLGPLIQPRYVASIEERIFIEGEDQQRIPDIWVQKVPESSGGTAVAATDSDTPLVLEVKPLEIRERYIEILDRYQDLKVVTVIEMVSPSNKKPGPGRQAYLEKRREALAGKCHLVEIDLLRTGRHIVRVPKATVQARTTYQYLICVSRSPHRRRFEVYPCRLRDRLPRIRVPLAAPDPDVTLDIQAALNHVYEAAGYILRVRYDKPCVPPLSPADQEWARQQWLAYRASRPDLFPPTGS